MKLVIAGTVCAGKASGVFLSYSYEVIALGTAPTADRFLNVMKTIEHFESELWRES